MKILALNVGSSSIKFGIFNTEINDSRIFKAEFSHFEDKKSTLHYRCGGEKGIEQKRTESI